MQGGPVVNVHMPKDRITLLHQGYGFVEVGQKLYVGKPTSTVKEK